MSRRWIFSHKNKKSRVSANDEITPSRSVLAPKSDPTHKGKQSHRSSSCRARLSNLSPSDQRQSNEVAAALSEITNMLTKVVARLDAQEKILKITISASSSSSTYYDHCLDSWTSPLHTHTNTHTQLHHNYAIFFQRGYSCMYFFLVFQGFI